MARRAPRNASSRAGKGVVCEVEDTLLPTMGSGEGMLAGDSKRLPKKGCPWLFEGIHDDVDDKDTLEADICILWGVEGGNNIEKWRAWIRQKENQTDPE